MAPGDTHITEDGTATCTIDLGVYPLPALQRACYWFTDACFIELSPGPTPELVLLRIRPKDGAVDSKQLVGEFWNALLDYALRHQIEQETAPIRELIYSQAFVEADETSDG
jgi:His-Xaa-Ser system protein HxsD